MKTFKVAIGKPTRKGMDTLHWFCVNSEASHDELRKHYNRQYSGLEVGVEEVKTVNIESADKDLYVHHSGYSMYSDPSHTIKVDETMPEARRLVEQHVKKIAETKKIEESIGELYKDFIRRPRVTSVGDGQVTIQGHFKSTIFSLKKEDSKDGN